MRENHVISYMPVWEKHLEMFEELGLDDARRGRLMTMMMKYHFYGEQPEELDSELMAIWFFIRRDLDSARKQYMQSVENGKKAAAKRKKTGQEEAEETRRNPEEAEQTRNNPEATITRTESRTESTTRSGTNTGTGTKSGSAPAGAGICAREKAYGEYGWVKLTDQQYHSLQSQMGDVVLGKCIHYIDRSAQSTGNGHRWKDWHLMLRRCYEEGWYLPTDRKATHRKTVPQGASGELGEAELEAIRRVLAE